MTMIKPLKGIELSHVPGIPAAVMPEDSKDMLEFIDANPKALGFANHQVRVDHVRYFVVVKDTKFPARVILNPSYSSYGENVPARMIDAEAFKNVDEEVPNLTKAVEGCMSFPWRKTIEVPRFHVINAKFDWFSEDGVMNRFDGVLNGREAWVFQHETDHCDGITIYFRK